MVIKNNIKNNKEHLIFDIDGTLTKFENMSDLVKEAIEPFGYFGYNYVELQHKAVKKLLEKSKNNKRYFNIDNFAKELHISMNIDYNHAIKIAEKMLELSPEYTVIFDGVKETLPIFNQDMFCLSDWFIKEQIAKLKVTGIEKYFRKVYTCEGNYAKPNPKRFKAVLKAERIDANRCVMIGDSYKDLGASSVGIETILIDYSKEDKNLYDKADAVITDFRDLPKILRR